MDRSLLITFMTTTWCGCTAFLKLLFWSLSSALLDLQWIHTNKLLDPNQLKIKNNFSLNTLNCLTHSLLCCGLHNSNFQPTSRGGATISGIFAQPLIGKITRTIVFLFSFQNVSKFRQKFNGEVKPSPLVPKSPMFHCEKVLIREGTPVR